MSPGQPSTQSCLYLCPPKVGTHFFFFLSFFASPLLLSVFLRKKLTAQSSSLILLSYSPPWRSVTPTTPLAAPGLSPSPEPRLTSPCALSRPCSSERRPAGSRGRAGRGRRRRRRERGRQQWGIESRTENSLAPDQVPAPPLLPSAAERPGPAPPTRTGVQSPDTASGPGDGKMIAREPPKGLLCNPETVFVPFENILLGCPLPPTQSSSAVFWSRKMRACISFTN